MAKQVELLAPCGNYESFLAAVNAGADAVYLGGKEFGARAYADNFTEEELLKAIRQAHLFGVKVYMTLNTLLREQEMRRLYEYLLPFYETGLDGVILQDVGVLRLLRRSFPDLALHASTQMTITGVYGAAYLKQAGCSRVVPARELSLDEIRAIKEAVPMEIETFIHGAMCYCYSGQCLMSSMIGGRSGNRGRCAQPCRLPYKAAGKEGYYLSLKDMNTLKRLPELIEAGIDSFKIEGRMKRPEYVAGVVSVYRKYIDAYYAGQDRESLLPGKDGNRKKFLSPGKEPDTAGRHEKKARSTEQNPGNHAEKLTVSAEDQKMLSGLYIRSEAGGGYLDRARGRDMLTLQSPGYNEVSPALLEKLRRAYVHDLLEIALKMRVICRVGEPLSGEAAAFLPTRQKSGRQASCQEKKGQGGAAWHRDRDVVTGKESPLREIRAAVFGPVVKKAEKRALSEEELRSQMIKTGGTPFTVAECRITLEDHCFVPVKWIKDLRRGLLEKIYEACGGRRMLDAAYETRGAGKASDETGLSAYGIVDGKEKESPVLTAVIQTLQQFGALYPLIRVRQEKPWEEYLIVDADLLCGETEIQKILFAGNIPWGIKCPVIIRKQDGPFLKKLRALIEEGRPEILYCATIDALAWAKSISFPGKIAGEASLYAWNREAYLFWERELDQVSTPLELKSGEIRELCGLVDNRPEAFVYGRTPLMVSANCIRLSAGQCESGGIASSILPAAQAAHGVNDIFHQRALAHKKAGGYTELTDRLGKVFPVYTNCAHCYNIIYNCLPTSYHDDFRMLWQDKIRRFRLEFTTESGEQAADIWKTFRLLLSSQREREKSGKAPSCREKDRIQERFSRIGTTTGRLRLGVE